MRRRYSDCEREDGNCAACSLPHDGRDCHDRLLTNLTLCRMRAGIGQPTLAEKSGVSIRQIQNVELGTALAENLSAKNFIALADALGADPHDLF